MELHVDKFGIFVFGILLGLLTQQSDALTCYQCNVFIRGTPWDCNSDRGMKEVHDCHACLKTYTRTYLHNTFHDQILTSFTSRVCVKDRDYLLDDGCYPQEIASGYMKRCFCYTDRCNSSNQSTSSLVAMVTCSIVSLFYVIR